MTGDAMPKRPTTMTEAVDALREGVRYTDGYLRAAAIQLIDLWDHLQVSLDDPTVSREAQTMEYQRKELEELLDAAREEGRAAERQRRLEADEDGRSHS